MDFRCVQFSAVLQDLSYEVDDDGQLVITSRSPFPPVSSVWVNGQELSYTAPDRYTLVVPLPSYLSDIYTVEVWTDVDDPDESQMVQLAVGDLTGMVSGKQQVIQQFVFQLFKSAGSDTFNPSDGAGLRKIVGRFSTSDSGGTTDVFLSEVDRVVKLASKQLRQKQLDYLGRLKPEERFINASIMSASYDEDTGVVRLKLKVVTAATEQLVGLEL